MKASNEACEILWLLSKRTGLMTVSTYSRQALLWNPFDSQPRTTTVHLHVLACLQLLHMDSFFVSRNIWVFVGSAHDYVLEQPFSVARDVWACQQSSVVFCSLSLCWRISSRSRHNCATTQRSTCTRAPNIELWPTGSRRQGDRAAAVWNANKLEASNAVFAFDRRT